MMQRLLVAAGDRVKAQEAPRKRQKSSKRRRFASASANNLTGLITKLEAR
jgi:hypothetical protein